MSAGGHVAVCVIEWSIHLVALKLTEGLCFGIRWCRKGGSGSRSHSESGEKNDPECRITEAMHSNQSYKVNYKIKKILNIETPVYKYKKVLQRR